MLNISRVSCVQRRKSMIFYQSKRHEFTPADWKGSTSLLYGHTNLTHFIHGIPFTPMGAFKNPHRPDSARLQEQKKKKETKINVKRRLSSRRSPQRLSAKLQLRQLRSVSLFSLQFQMSPTTPTVFLSPLADSSCCFIIIYLYFFFLEGGWAGGCVRSQHPLCPR